jgi:hypothetical protein
MTERLCDRFNIFQPPFLHCLCQKGEELGWVEESCAQNSLKLYRVDLTGVDSKPALLNRFAITMGFPSYFGGNWDAFIDCATDLSWDRHPGYVVEVSGAESLMKLPTDIVKTFLLACGKDIPSRWQAREDEYGRSILPTPFHFVLLGSEAFCELVRLILSRPLDSLSPGD